MKTARASTLSFITVAFLALSGCGGSGSDGVLADSATSFSIDSSGGGLPGPIPIPAGACDPQVWSYTVHLDTSMFDWDRCDVSSPGTSAGDYTRSSGSRALSPTELDTARSAARM